MNVTHDGSEQTPLSVNKILNWIEYIETPTSMFVSKSLLEQDILIHQPNFLDISPMEVIHIHRQSGPWKKRPGSCTGHPIHNETTIRFMEKQVRF